MDDNKKWNRFQYKNVHNSLDSLEIRMCISQRKCSKRTITSAQRRRMFYFVATDSLEFLIAVIQNKNSSQTSNGICGKTPYQRFFLRICQEISDLMRQNFNCNNVKITLKCCNILTDRFIQSIFLFN